MLLALIGCRGAVGGIARAEAIAVRAVADPDEPTVIHVTVVDTGNGRPDMLPDHLITRGLTFLFAHQRLVVLKTRIGRTADAARHWDWEIFLGVFTNPDSEFRHLIDEACEALRAGLGRTVAGGQLALHADDAPRAVIVASRAARSARCS